MICVLDVGRRCDADCVVIGQARCLDRALGGCNISFLFAAILQLASCGDNGEHLYTRRLREKQLTENPPHSSH